MNASRAMRNALRAIGLGAAAPRATGELFALRPGASPQPTMAYAGAPQQGTGDARPFRMVAPGVAEVCVTGFLAKDASFLRIFGLSAQPTLPEIAASIRAAAFDADVRGIMLYVDSPGGTVHGMSEVIAELAAARARKPVHAFAECAASGAYWLASQAHRLTTSLLADLGSIGVVSWHEDASQLAENIGLKVHVVRTGPYKAAGAEPLAGISEAELAYFRERADDVLDHFLPAVAAGRGLALARVRELADGKCYATGRTAVGLGLADAVTTYPEAVAALVAAIATPEAAAAPPVAEPATPIDEEAAPPIPEVPEESKMSTTPNADTPPAGGNAAEEERGALQRLREAFASFMGGSAVQAPPNAALAAAPVALTEAQISAQVKEQVNAALASQGERLAAEMAVDRDLAALSGRVPPAVLNKPNTRASLLRAKAEGPEVYADQLALVAGNDASALLGGPIADAEHADDARVATETEAMLERNGITPERAAELTKRYHVSVN